MVSALDTAKRMLVSVLRAIAVLYNVNVNVSRESTDAAVTSAYRAMSLKAHPDRGGSTEDYSSSVPSPQSTQTCTRVCRSCALLRERQAREHVRCEARRQKDPDTEGPNPNTHEFWILPWVGTGP